MQLAHACAHANLPGFIFFSNMRVLISNEAICIGKKRTTGPFKEPKCYRLAPHSGRPSSGPDRRSSVPHGSRQPQPLHAEGRGKRQADILGLPMVSFDLYLASVVKSSKVTPQFWPPSSYFHQRHLLFDRLQAFTTVRQRRSLLVLVSSRH